MAAHKFPKILAVNTATKTMSLALTEGEKTLYLYETTDTRDQGNLLLNHIEAGLKHNNLAYQDLDLLAGVVGPGSFTGIRVGLATMRGLAMAAEKPLIGFSSFDLFADPLPGGLNIVAVESWREELYFALLDEDSHPLLECRNEKPEAYAAWLQEHHLPGSHPVNISGDAALTLAPFLPGVPVVEKQTGADHLARLALRRFREAGENITPDLFPSPTPYYLREADVTFSSKVSKKLAENR